MNKYIIIGFILVALMGGGALYSTLTREFTCTSDQGIERDITIVSKKLEWRFEPDSITVEQCDKINITLINEDDFDHGFAIDAFGVSQRLPASETIFINFVATKGGVFPFYCSVSCGSGIVDAGPYKGDERGHFDQIGEFIASLFDKVTGN